MGERVKDKYFILKPKKGIGLILLGELISFELCDKFNLEDKGYNEITEWTKYENESIGICIYTELRKIVSIACYKKCILDNINLIGLDIAEFNECFNYKSNEVEEYELSDGIQQVYEFEEISTQLWVSNGKIVSVIISDD